MAAIKESVKTCYKCRHFRDILFLYQDCGRCREEGFRPGWYIKCKEKVFVPGAKDVKVWWAGKCEFREVQKFLKLNAGCRVECPVPPAPVRTERAEQLTLGVNKM